MVKPFSIPVAIAAVCALLTVPGVARCADYRAAIAEIPSFASAHGEGILIDLVRAIEQETGDHISVEVYPFARAINHLTSGQADMHIPLIKNDIVAEENLPFLYSSESIGQANFVLYTRKGSGITPANLDGLVLETEGTHIDYFPFKTLPSRGAESSLMKLSMGRIDAFLYADQAADPILKALGLGNVRRQLFKTYEAKILFQKSQGGRALERKVSAAISRLKASGRLQQIIPPLYQTYDDWQP